MDEFELRRVQRLTLESTQSRYKLLACAFRQTKTPAVHGITEQRMPAVCKVHANLVGATRIEFYTYVGVRRESLAHGVVSNRWFAIIANTHALAISAMSANGFVDSAATGQNAVANGQVVTRYNAIRQ